ncbi:MAG: ABC transporter substrate-binding protein, partial [Pseudomonadota bacterium]
MVVILALALVTAVAAGVCAQGKVIRFGFPVDYTRVYIFVTEEWVQGMVDYLELMNLKGGVGGTKFEWLVVD